MTDPSLHLFTYGTLQIPEVMQAVTGKKFPSFDAVLDDYCRYSIRDEIYPAVIAETGASVCGRLYSGLDWPVLKILDVFEDNIYIRREIDVTTMGDNIIKAHVYVLSDQHREILSEEPWELEHFTHDYLDKYLTVCRKFFRDYKSKQSG